MTLFRVFLVQALAIKDGADFQHILRILGTNVDGKQKVMYAMCSVKGVGRRFSNIVCKKADVDMDKRAGTTLIVILHVLFVMLEFDTFSQRVGYDDRF